MTVMKVALEIEKLAQQSGRTRAACTNTNWIFLRGWVRGKNHWGDFEDFFKKTFPQCEITFMDLPGNGERYLEKTPLQLQQVVEDFESQLSKKKTYSILGHSLGGMIALQWLETYPKRFESAVIVNSSSAKVSSVFKRLRPSSLLNLFNVAKAKTLTEKEQAIYGLIANNSERRQQCLPAVIAASEKGSSTLGNAARQLVLAMRLKLRFESSVPLLFLSSKADRLVSYECSQDLATAYKANLQLHDWAGHDLFMDDPEWVCGKIKSFLD